MHHYPGAGDDHWPQMMGTNNQMAGIVSSFLPLIQFSHIVILSYRYHYCCLIIWRVDVLFIFWFLVITRRLTRRGTHKCPMGPINCWYPQSQSQPPPKRSITTHNLSLWKLAKNGATIYTTVNTDILQQQINIYSWVPSTNPAQNLCSLNHMTLLFRFDPNVIYLVIICVKRMTLLTITKTVIRWLWTHSSLSWHLDALWLPAAVGTRELGREN